MRISPINQHNLVHARKTGFSLRNNNSSFSSNFAKSVNLEKGQIINPKTGIVYINHTTCWARKDLEWRKFGEYLKQKYPSIDKVDIDVFACSTGEEAYTMAILLHHLYPNSKFQINAYDIDKETVEVCKLNQKYGIYIDKFDLVHVQEELGISDKELNNYFIKNDDTAAYVLKDKIAKEVQFDKANILTAYNKINRNKPTILMARNVWPYINESEYRYAAKNLYEYLAPESIVITGRFDRVGSEINPNSNMFPTEMRRNHFEHPPRKLKNGFDFSDRTRRYIFEIQKKNA